MTIHVTPIPSTIDFSTTTPTTVTQAAQSAVIGTETAAQRGDHVHASEGFGDLAGPGSSTDNAVARFDGTTGKLLQGYSSAAPTFTDAGVMALTSGQLGFPATVNVSSDANTLDDYEEGTFTPYLSDNSGSASASQAYTYQIGRYTRVGNICHVQIVVGMSSLGSLTTGEPSRIAGLPFPTEATAGNEGALVVGVTAGLNITAGTTVGAYMPEDTSRLYPSNWDATTGISRLTVGEYSADGKLSLSGVYEVKD